MALDALTILALKNELTDTLLNSKIDKVYQPEKDEIAFKMRNNKKAYKLVLSASASNPRVFLANKYEKSNPKKAPDFCMTLRKHIQGGIITDIKQPNFERILIFSIESYNELREKTTKDLCIEIMGRHSNIMLINKDTNKVIDSIKRVPISISRVRQILPGIDYELPPKQNKLNPLNTIHPEDLYTDFKNFNGFTFKAIYTFIQGISPLLAKEICYRAGVNPTDSTTILAKEQIENFAKIINTICNDLSSNKSYPNIIIDEKIDKLLDFSCIKITMFNDKLEIHNESMSTIIEDYYITKDSKERIHQRAYDMKKGIQIKLDRAKTKLKKQEKELKASKNAPKYKLRGELLTANIYKIKEGMKSLKVTNFYSENLEEIEIMLNENISPSKNAQKYFKKYNKLKHASTEITKQIKLNLNEIYYLENTILGIENCDNFKELKEIKEELIKYGYIKSAKAMPKRDTGIKTSPHKYISTQGLEILVGKNNKQNDFITMRLADNDDLWFHTKNIPGSHVLIKSAGIEVDEQTILEAATLAAHYSKAKLSENVAVDYTKKKNIKKPSGAKPGFVTYSTNNTVYVTPSDENLAKIKKSI